MLNNTTVGLQTIDFENEKEALTFAKRYVGQSGLLHCTIESKNATILGGSVNYDKHEQPIKTDCQIFSKHEEKHWKEVASKVVAKNKNRRKIKEKLYDFYF